MRNPMHPSLRLFVAILACTVAGGLSSVAAAESTGTIQLSPAQLYQGFDARKVVLSPDSAKLSLDPRVFKAAKNRDGHVVTDPLDLGPSDGILGLPADVKSVEIEVAAETPEGASLSLEVRSGKNKLDDSGWSQWSKFDGNKATVTPLTGRYIQVGIILKAADVARCPAITGLTLKPQLAGTASSLPPVKVAASALLSIVRSPIPFAYERPDNPKLVKFRKDAKLDEVVAGARDDFEKLVKLMEWVGSCNNDRTLKRESSGGFYQWDIEKLFEVREVEKEGKKVPQPTIFGHCMSYCEVMVTAATAMGYVGSRHMAKEGYNQRSHEVCDIWVPSLGKWVYFDPSLTSYYTDKETREKLNQLELHQLVLDKFVPDGKDTAWFAAPGNNEVKSLVKKIGGKTVVDCRLGPWSYGVPMDPSYDWGTRHGYMCSGFVQMTPRNDFHSHPEANPKRLGSYPGYAGYPFWVDAKTNPKKGVTNWYTRKRDFYWTLDQASANLVRTADGKSVEVQLGNSMPFFKKYQLKVNGAEVADAANPFLWSLKPGQNTLEVAPVDEFGKVGLASSVTLESTK